MLAPHVIDFPVGAATKAAPPARRSGAGALIVPTDPLFIGRREQIVALAIHHAIPTIFAKRESVAAGGLMSFSP